MSYSLKDQFFAIDFIDTFAQHLRDFFPNEQAEQQFVAICRDDWPQLELKERMSRIASTTVDCLQRSHADMLEVVRKVAPSVTGFQGMILPEIVEQLGTDLWEESVEVLKEITQYSSSEFAIRPFIESQPERAFELFNEWTQDSNEHVRRLASEGCRPRLPWASALPALKQDPTPILPVITALCDDSSEYVRRSAANNLNDIAKDNPDVALATAQQWHKLGAIWATRHGMRTLLKQGVPEVMRLFGYKAPQVADVAIEVAPKQVKRGADAYITLELELLSSQLVRIDMGMHFVRKHGRNEKKFKIVDKIMDAGEAKLTKSFSFRELSTRTYYPGTHAVEMYVNGESIGSCEFEVV